ncbi:hypothetical protein ACFQ49_05100 [Kroppenstedtia eburnea]|uniref:hypothetical protein n=1 Tax=Kroppenstedtia eburnea TaxID=714067 RepID=UPI0036331929
MDGTLLSELTETINNQGRKIGVKLNDRMKALEMLAKHLGMYDDAPQNKNTNININVRGSRDGH